MSNREKYREFCKNEIGTPVFSQDWWLDAVCVDGVEWDVAIVEKGGKIMATMPYALKKEGMFNTIVMPTITQTLGPYILYPEGQKYYKRVLWEKEMMTALIEQLPQVDSFNQSWYHGITNWLPFYWKNFNQSTRYTYTLQGVSVEEFENNMEPKRKQRIRKVKRMQVDSFESEDIEKFYEVNMKTFERQDLDAPYSLDFIKRVYDATKERDACKMFFAKDVDGKIIAVNFLLIDRERVYYLMSGIDPDRMNIGGIDLVVSESIRFALETNRIFDFEGSMIESIEKYFRSYGAEQTAYSQIFKTNAKWKVKSLIDKVLKK